MCDNINFFLIVIFSSVIRRSKFVFKASLTLCYIFLLGERTLGVLTKIDLMDKGTDAVDVSFFDSLYTNIN